MKRSALLILSMLVLVGCPAVDTKELNFTRKKPAKADLIGVWTPDKETIQAIRTRGHYPEAKHQIVLRADGSFSIQNMPDWWTNGFGESGGTFASFDGRWDIEEGKNGWTIWELSLQTPTFGTSINLYRQKPPYSLFIRVGDPNNGDAMIFDRMSTELKPNQSVQRTEATRVAPNTNRTSSTAGSSR